MASYVNGFNKETLIQRCCMVSTPYKTLGHAVEDDLLPLEIKTNLCDIYNLYSIVTYDDWRIYRDRTTNKLYVVDLCDVKKIIKEVVCTAFVDYDKNYKPRVNGKIVKDYDLDSKYPNNYCGEFDDMIGYGYFVEVDPIPEGKSALVVYLCKECQEQFLEEFGDDMGYTVPVKVITVPKSKCDYSYADKNETIFKVEKRKPEYV
jgi:hypothetical protein